MERPIARGWTKRKYVGRGNEEAVQSGPDRGAGHSVVRVDSARFAATTPGSTGGSSSHAW